MRIISRRRDLRPAWEDQHALLARRIVRLLPPGPITVVEIGCGQGQLTIPLAAKASRARVIGIDSFAGPYASSRERLLWSLERSGLAERVQVKAGDGLSWLSRQRAKQFDAIVSSEFLPELTSKEMADFFDECHRVVRVGGTTTHVFLSPVPRNPAQALTIEADSDPHWTVHPPKEWFAPPLEPARLSLVRAGFGDVGIKIIPSRLRFADQAARQQLRNWGVREEFDRSHRVELASRGLELPDWVVLSGTRRR